MDNGDVERREADRRSLLTAVLAHVRLGTSCSGPVGPALDPTRVTDLLGPAARADASIEWIAVNGERVDATLAARESQWRVVFGSASGTTIDWLEVFERPDSVAGVAGGRAVVINGPSGAGKSSLMNAIREIARVPFVTFDEPEHVGTVQPEYLIWRERAPALHRGYLVAIAALARSGNHVAVSASGHPLAELAEVFGDVPLLSVGLRCDEGVLLERERRSGRWGGIAAGSSGVHDGWHYDIEFDTTVGPDPRLMARRVLDRM